VKIVVTKFGSISSKRENELVTFLTNCYERLKPHDIEMVDFLLFTTSSEMERFYHRERRDIGVASDDFSNLFFALHDAWRGTSRIAVCLEKMENLPKLVQKGVLQHEVGHSILHGSLEYYLFPFPLSLIEASEKFQLSKEYTSSLLYLLSIVAKDVEVTHLLVEKGYLDDQIAYAASVFKMSKEDSLVWKLVNGNGKGMAFSLAGRLKDTACYMALQNNVGKKVAYQKLKRELSYLPDWIFTALLTLLERYTDRMSTDTFQNVNSLVDLFIDSLLKPLFLKFESTSYKPV
jgi:hypothetical protein